MFEIFHSNTRTLRMKEKSPEPQWDPAEEQTDAFNSPRWLSPTGQVDSAVGYLSHNTRWVFKTKSLQVWVLVWLYLRVPWSKSLKRLLVVFLSSLTKLGGKKKEDQSFLLFWRGRNTNTVECDFSSTWLLHKCREHNAITHCDNK